MEYRFKIFVIFVVLGTIIVHGEILQQTPNNRIKWIQSISSLDSKHSNFLTKLFYLIVGRGSFEILSQPISLVQLNNGELRILDQKNRSIWGYNSSKNKLYLASKRNEKYPSLVGICDFGNDDIAFTDSYLNEAYVLSVNGQVKKLVRDSVSLKQPTGIAYSKKTNQIWVVETAAHRISIFSLEGILLKRIGTRGNGSGQFNYPTFISIDDRGMVYIVDSMNFRVQILDHNGNYISTFGEIGDATGYFARPKGIATDSFGNIYVVDGLFHTIQIFNSSGEFLFNFGSQGRADSQLWMPTGIYIDKQDNIFIADTYNSRIQVFKLLTD